MPPVNLALARKYHQAGQLQQALQVYQQLLAQDPQRAELLHGFGLALHQAGHSQRGVQYLTQAVERQPQTAQFAHTLGLALCDLGQIPQAKSYFQQALKAKPSFIDSQMALGQVAQAEGAWDEAEAAFRGATKSNPQSAEAHYYLGAVLQQQQQPIAALPHLRKAAKLNPGWAEAHYNLGVVLLELDESSEASSSFHKALKLKPDWPEAHNNLGKALADQGKTEEAFSHYHTALQLNPRFEGALQNLGTLLHQEEQTEAAIDCFEKVLALNPNLPKIQSALGLLYQAQDKLEQAITCYCQALVSDPQDARTLHNLSGSLRDFGDLEAAIQYGTQVLELAPDMPEAYFNFGVFLQDQDRVPEAIPYFEKAIALKPDYPQANFNLGTAHLFLGRFAEGWAGYEWRWKLGKLFKLKELKFERPLWDGSPLVGKTILIQREQGFGDNIQFVRYANLLKAQGARVLLLTLPPEQELLGSCPGIDQIIGEGDTIPDFDCHVPLVSLPLILGTTVDTVPNQVPYLSAPQRAPRPHEAPLLAEGLKVGLNWKGQVTFRDDARRHCRLEDLAPLMAIPGITFFSLYRGADYGELNAYPELIDLGSQFRNFSDTAYALSKLDLVISIDTSVLHLAGALARPTWGLLRFVPDWRWMRTRLDTPWYPTMRLFRQPAAGDWATLVQEVQLALHQRLMLAAHPT